MKKIILVVVLAFSLISLSAQEKDQFTKDAEKLVAIISGEAFKPVVAQYAAMVDEGKRDEFTKEVEGTLPALYEGMAKIYVAEFTHEEIKAFLTFYATPAGTKLASKTGVLTQKGMAVGQEWAMKLMEILGQYNK